jgi:hypothetical protein
LNIKDQVCLLKDYPHKLYAIVSLYSYILVWKPKLPDAVDIIIDRILNSSTIEPIQGFSDEELAHFGKLRGMLRAYSYLFLGFD